jgi:hypothetical protein
VKCGEWLWVGETILYRSEIGYLGITRIVREDENPIKLDDHGFVRYHGSQIRKLKNLVNGRLEDNATAHVWRETAEFHLKPGELQDYYTRKSIEAQCEYTANTQCA